MLFYTPILARFFSEMESNVGERFDFLVNGTFALVELLEKTFELTLINVKLVAALH